MISSWKRRKIRKKQWESNAKCDWPEYRAWQQFKQRCLNPYHPCYSKYGGRGIGIDPDWIDSFDNFYADVGPKPTPQHYLSRYDEEGDFEPGNVYWASYRESSN